MEAAAAAALRNPTAYNLPSCFFSGKNIKHFSKLSGGLKFQWKKKKKNNNKSGLLAITGCLDMGSSSSLPDMEKQKLETEMMMMMKPEEEEEEEEEEEWWLKMGNLMRGKCSKEGKEGMVELLECLEREAIMGDDEGNKPTDYNRRAQIFDKSSRVFQALKDRSSSSSSSSAHHRSSL